MASQHQVFFLSHSKLLLPRDSPSHSSAWEKMRRKVKDKTTKKTEADRSSPGDGVLDETRMDTAMGPKLLDLRNSTGWWEPTHLPEGCCLISCYRLPAVWPYSNALIQIVVAQISTSLLHETHLKTFTHSSTVTCRTPRNGDHEEHKRKKKSNSVIWWICKLILEM